LNVSDTVRNNIVAVLAEFVGTFMFLFLAFAGTQVANNITTHPESDTMDPSVLIVISMSFGFSLMANAWAFYRVSGGLFNPTVSLALYLVGGISLLRFILVSIAQIVGGIAAAGLVAGLFPGPLNVATSLRPGTRVVQGLFIEMFLTAELVFVIIMLAAEKHRSTHMAPIGIGFAFLVTELTGVFLTGGSLNPARSFGPDVVTGDFPGYHWIYWVGPGLGALLASGFFIILKKLRYRECNPGPDWEDMEKMHPQQGPH
ncbi:MIP family channel protein, partial [Coniochaeta sp. PMI_546]